MGDHAALSDRFLKCHGHRRVYTMIYQDAKTSVELLSAPMQNDGRSCAELPDSTVSHFCHRRLFWPFGHLSVLFPNLFPIFNTSRWRGSMLDLSGDRLWYDVEFCRTATVLTSLPLHGTHTLYIIQCNKTVLSRKGNSFEAFVKTWVQKYKKYR